MDNILSFQRQKTPVVVFYNFKIATYVQKYWENSIFPCFIKNNIFHVRIGEKKDSLFQEISKRAQQKQSSDVPINRVNNFTNTNVECNPRHNMEPCKAQLQCQQCHKQLHFLCAFFCHNCLLFPSQRSLV